MQIEKVVDGHKRRGVHVAVTSEEGAEVNVVLLAFVIVVKFHDVEVFFSVEEFVLKVAQETTFLRLRVIPVGEQTTTVQFGCFEWFVVDQRQELLLVYHVLNNFAPDRLIRALSEQQVVD